MISVVFVCLGNICRSPMAERIAERRFAEAGLDDVVVSSAATSTEQIGNPIDSRAVQTLESVGLRTVDHAARQITRDLIADADLVVAMEQIHIDRMRRIYGGDLPRVVLLSDFDPQAKPGDPVPDPWYGDQDGFEATLEMIERAMPALIERVRGLQR